MFTLTRESNTVNAGKVAIGHAFQFEGEICVRAKLPTHPPFDKAKILAISLETWELRSLDPEEPVDMVVVDATSRPMAHP